MNMTENMTDKETAQITDTTPLFVQNVPQEQSMQLSEPDLALGGLNNCSDNSNEWIYELISEIRM